MSATSFVDNPKARVQFKRAFLKPKISFSGFPLLAPLPKHKDLAIIGIAFDYFVRFKLMREHKTAICHPWFAGASLISSGRSKIGLKEKKTIKEARKALDSYLKNGKLSDALIKKTLRLATLETFKRSWMPGIFLDFRISAAHLEDLRNLLSIYDKRPFQPTNYLELNPSFGRATDAIGGADADLICDNTIFDIKTSKNLEIDRDDFNRQVVYYLLNKLDSGGQPRPKITNLGFYFARYGVFVNYKIEDIIIEEKYKYFMGWFKKNIRWRFYR